MLSASSPSTARANAAPSLSVGVILWLIQLETSFRVRSSKKCCSSSFSLSMLLDISSSSPKCCPSNCTAISLPVISPVTVTLSPKKWLCHLRRKAEIE